MAIPPTDKSVGFPATTKMNIEQGTIRGSPYIGVFAVVTDKVALIPNSTFPKEDRIIERAFGIDVLKILVAESSLLGVFVKGNSRGFLVPWIALDKEVDAMKSFGLRVMRVENATALGNLIAVNDKAGIASPLLDAGEVKKIGTFLGVKMSQRKIAGTDLPGSCIAVTNKGFVVHPNISEKEFELVEELFGLKGKAGTANYGDPFVGNSIIANSNAAVVGTYTSGHELARIDEGLRGE